MRTLRLLLALAPVLALPRAPAQQITRQELALGYAGVTDTSNGGNSVPAGNKGIRGLLSGPALRYTLNLNRNLALEAIGTGSLDSVPYSDREGGNQILALGGLKAGIRRGRFGFFGTFDLGATSFSHVQELTPLGLESFDRVTHFTLQQGAALEISLSRRDFLRVDAGELLDTQFQRVFTNTPTFRVASYSGVPYHLQTSLTFAHRFGSMQPLAPEPDRSNAHNLSLGGFLVTGIRQHLLSYDTHADGGGGAWVGIPLWRFLSADLVAYDQPHDDRTAGPQDGGTSFSAFAGPKLGFRKGPLGLFVKARPGLERFSRTNTFQNFYATPYVNTDHPKIDFALDTGLVLEFSPPARTRRHPFLRFEGGSVYTHYSLADLQYVNQVPHAPILLQTGNAYYPPQRHSSLVFLTGAGFSF